MTLAGEVLHAGRYGTLATLNVSLIYAHLHTCPSACAGFYYSNLVWQRDHTKVERKIVSTLAENGPAMAGPAGPVLV